MIKLNRLFRSTTNVLGYCGLYAFNSIILGNQDIVNGLGGIVASAPTVIPLVKDFLSEAIPGEIVEKLKSLKDDVSFGNNGDLDGVIKTALNNAIASTKSVTIKRFNADESNRTEISYFANYIKVSFDNFVVNDDVLQQFVYHRKLFLASILDVNNYEHPKITCASLDNFYAFFFESFLKEFEKYFLEEIKRDDKAKTAYFVFLLETSARLGSDNNDFLIQLSATAKELEEKVGISIGLLRSIARTLTVLSKQGTDLKIFKRDLGEFIKRIDARQEPFLTLFQSDLNTKDAQRFNFKERYTNFIGRDKEIASLWDFFIQKPEQRFKWWIVTGSGGMGKSRLALEFCLEAQYLNYNVGFLSNSAITTFDWSHWQPNCPTFVVIDYATTQNDKLIDSVLEILSNRVDTLENPVRILLLDREVRPDWQKKILALPTSEKSYYKDEINDVLDLPDLTDEVLWEIIVQVFEHASKDVNIQKVDTIQQLHKIDPQKRPLFAFFVGVALAEGDSIRDWNVSELLDYHLNRLENNVWSKDTLWGNDKWQDSGSKYKNLFALITLCRGLSLDQLQQVQSQNLDCLPNIIEPTLLQILSQKVTIEGETTFAGLEPDILGEYFLLQQFDKLNEREEFLNGSEQLSEIFKIAWDTSWRKVGPMISIIVDDFETDFPEITTKLKLAKPLASSETETWIMWAMSQVLITVDPLTTNLSLDVYTYKYIVENKDLFPNSASGISTLAMAYDGYVRHFSSLGNINKALELQDELLKISVGYQHLKDIQSSIATCKFNLIDGYLNLNKVVDALKTNNELSEFVRPLSDNIGVQVGFATSSSNLIKVLGQSGNVQKALELYEKFTLQIVEYSNNRDIQIQKASSIVDLLANLNKYIEGSAIKSDALFNDLTAISNSFPDDYGIQLKFARGIVNILANSIILHDKLKAVSSYKKLRDITNRQGNTLELQSELFKGNFTLINFLDDISGEINVLSLNVELLALLKANPRDFEMQKFHNIARPKIVRAFCQKNRINDANTEFSQLKFFAQQNINIPDVQLAVSKAIIWLIEFSVESMADDGVRESAFYKIDELANDLVQLAFQNGDNVEIQINCLNIQIFLKVVDFPADKEVRDQGIARNLQRIVSEFSKQQEIDKANEYYRMLDQLYNEKSENAKIAIHLAMAVNNLISASRIKNIATNAFEDMLNYLFHKFPNDANMITFRKMITNN